MKLTKKHPVAGLAVAAVASLAVGSSVSAVTSSNPFGLEYGSATGLGKLDVRDTISKIIYVALSLLGIVALVVPVVSP